MSVGATTTAAEVMGGARLDGCTAVVTGASGGIGLETARVLASAGAAVTLAIRDHAKGSAALAAIQSELPQASVTTAALDLASLQSTHDFCRAFSTEHERLDLLVNNAGVMFPPLTRTADGFELQFGTNHLGHFALTAGLLPKLIASNKARVVNVSSAGHRFSGIDFDDPNFEIRDYDKFIGYGQSKTANVLFGAELDRRYGERGVHSFSLHPGMIATDLARHMDTDDFNVLIERAKARAGGDDASSDGGETSAAMPSFKTIPQGAATSIWACIAPELDASGGAYCSDCAIATPELWASDVDHAQRLWDLSQQLTDTTFANL